MGSELREIEKKVDELTPLDKATLLKHILRSLDVTSSGIEMDPTICGCDPCIARTRIPVWLLVKFRQLGMSEMELLKNYPLLSASDLVNAWSYYASHRSDVDEQIKENGEE